MWESTYFFPLCTTKVDRYTSIIYMDIYADCSTCIAPPRSPFPEGIINYHSTNQSHVLWTWGFHKHACMDIQTTMGSTIRGMCVYYFLLYYLHYETVVIAQKRVIIGTHSWWLIRRFFIVANHLATDVNNYHHWKRCVNRWIEWYRMGLFICRWRTE